MTVLYRKYRPQKLSEIVGQEQVTNPLLKQLESGKIHHAYLFAGPRGTGKTSTARIVAKAVNCLATSGKGEETRKFGEPCNKCASCKSITEGRHLDLIEIDAASNRGIDDIRDLREKIKLSPSGGLFKVYIIDEAHMLTGEAFNALLKTLEEPPSHAIFILATTEPHKLPGTILSRVQRFDFGRPNYSRIVEKLSEIVKKEGWGIDSDSLSEIAKASGAAFRDAEVLLEKVAGVNPKAKRAEILQLIGKEEEGQILVILQTLEQKDTKKALIFLDDFTQEGGNIRVLNESLVEALRKILLMKVGLGEKLVRDVSPEIYQGFFKLSETIDQDRLNLLIKLFTRSAEELAMSAIPQLPLELAFIEACDFQAETSSESFSAPETLVEEIIANQEVSAKTQTNDKDTARAHIAKPNISDGKLLEKIKKAWSKILKDIKGKNNSLEIFLKKAKVDKVEEDTLFIKFYYRFHKDMVEEPRNREIVEEALEKEVAASVKIKGIMGERPVELVKESEIVKESKSDDDPVEIFGKIE
ncbi:MAG: DNA polymerase III subunit gamma/tau [Candidatus Woykebacteria bacterium]